jgi:hypothetical protein
MPLPAPNDVFGLALCKVNFRVYQTRIYYEIIITPTKGILELRHGALKGSDTGFPRKTGTRGACERRGQRGLRGRFDGGEGSCCTRRCIAGFQARHTDSW